MGADVSVLQLPVEDVDADTAGWNSPEDCSSEIMIVQQVHWSAASSNSRFVAPKLWNHLPPQIRSSSLTVSSWASDELQFIVSLSQCISFAIIIWLFIVIYFYHLYLSSNLIYWNITIIALNFFIVSSVCICCEALWSMSAVHKCAK